MDIKLMTRVLFLSLLPAGLMVFFISAVFHEVLPCTLPGVQPYHTTPSHAAPTPAPDPAGLMVFFISAVFHEVLVGVPLHMLRLWAFWGLMAQVPLMIITEWLKARFQSDRVGNIIFWVSFCFVGQPLAMILVRGWMGGRVRVGHAGQGEEGVGLRRAAVCKWPYSRGS